MRTLRAKPLIVIVATAVASMATAAAVARPSAAVSGTILAQAEQQAVAPRPLAKVGNRTGLGSLSGDSRPVRRLRQGPAARASAAGPPTPRQARPVAAAEREEASFAPTVSPTAEGALGQTATTRAAAGFTVFRNTVAGTSGSTAVEPTAANDRNGVLVTGNFYANTSDDGGLTFSDEPLDTDADEVYGGFCCDQVAYAVDRGDYSLVSWLLQYRYDPGAQRNALKLRLFRGRSALLSQADSCNWNFEPKRDFELEDEQWFDFNQMSHTAKYLYITTNVRDADEAPDPADASNDPRVGALILRIALDDLDDGDCRIAYRYWYEEGTPYISPVQNAGSTMYLGAHVPGFIEGDNLRIYSVADSSTELDKKDKDVSNYKDIDGDCPLPDGQDPCEDQHDGRMSGFRSGSTIGWLWMGDQDSGFPFPHVRVAVFETGSLDKVLEHQIWSRDFAWQLPSVGVNQQGDLGVLLYAMGGGRFPRVQGFILTDPRNWSSIQMNAIAASTSGADGWGHYGSVRAYGNCADTFLGSAYTSEGSTRKGRFIWFGQSGDGCADLSVTGLLAIPAGIARGEMLSMTQVTRNIGSASAGASTTRFYLSRDGAKSDDDILLGAGTAVPSLVANGSVVGPPASAAIPTSANGAYRIVACADDRTVVSEITDTNNCYTNTQTIAVTAP